MNKEQIKEKMKKTTPEEFVKFIMSEMETKFMQGYNKGLEDRSSMLPHHIDTAERIGFGLNELKEAKAREIDLGDLERDLSIRSCRFMKPVKTY